MIVLQGRRCRFGSCQCGLRDVNGAAHGASQPEGLLPSSRHPHVLHAALHHLHSVITGDARPAAARDARGRRRTAAAAAPARRTAPSAGRDRRQRVFPRPGHAPSPGGQSRKRHSA